MRVARTARRSQVVGWSRSVQARIRSRVGRVQRHDAKVLCRTLNADQPTVSFTITRDGALALSQSNGRPS